MAIGALLSTEPVVSTVRRLLRQLTPGLKVTSEEVANIISQEVIKREVQASEQGVEAQKSVKRAMARQAKKKLPRRERAARGTRTSRRTTIELDGLVGGFYRAWARRKDVLPCCTPLAVAAAIK